jgi:hypothetical protein
MNTEQKKENESFPDFSTATPPPIPKPPLDHVIEVSKKDSLIENTQNSERASYILAKYNTLAGKIRNRLKKNKSIREKDVELLKELYNLIPQYQNSQYAYDFPNIPKNYKKLK